MKINLINIILQFGIIINANSQQVNGVYIFNKMLSASKQVNTLQFNADMIERFEGKLHAQKSFVKVQHKPFMIYYRQDLPTVGAEVLYVSGKNKNNALVNPCQFPWVNMNLNPYNKELRVKQHHTLFKPGFRYFVDILSNLKNRCEDLDKFITFNGEEVAAGVDCYKITLNNPDFKYIKYTVKANEDVDVIADNHYISSYMILELNDAVKSYKDVSIGQQIIIPNSYAKKMVLFIDKERNVPVKMIIFDDKGLYEQYEFLNLKINHEFEIEEFQAAYKDYNF